MPKRLSPEQIASYHRDGFLSPVDVMSEAEAASYRARLEEAERLWPEAMAGALIDERKFREARLWIAKVRERDPSRAAALTAEIDRKRRR